MLAVWICQNTIRQFQTVTHFANIFHYKVTYQLLIMGYVITMISEQISDA